MSCANGFAKPKLHGLRRIFLTRVCPTCYTLWLCDMVHAALLTEHAIPSFKSIFPRGNGIFQQDNAPVHTSKVAQSVLTAAKVKTLRWPAYSPDLNPIENLWSVMECNLHKWDPPSNLAELRKMLQPPRYRLWHIKEDLLFALCQEHWRSRR